jgi:hypothetical protein
MMEKPNTKAQSGGCLDPQTGLYFREHFFLTFNNELARLDNYQKALGLLVVSLGEEPSWPKIGPRINAVLGKSDQCTVLDAQSAAILMPETGPKKVARILTDLNRELGPQARYGLTLVWPGHLTDCQEMLSKAQADLQEFVKTQQKLADEHGPWSARETALIPEEKESLYAGFGQLLAGS